MRRSAFFRSVFGFFLDQAHFILLGSLSQLPRPYVAALKVDVVWDFGTDFLAALGTDFPAAECVP